MTKHIASPISNLSHWSVSSVHEPIMTYHSHPKSRVLIRVHFDVAYYMDLCRYVMMYIHHMVLTESLYHPKASMLCSSATHPATVFFFSCTFLSQIKGFRDYFSATLIWRKRRERGKEIKEP